MMNGDIDKLKIVISDFHLGKGAQGENGRDNPLEYFFRDDDFVDLLRFYSSGTFSQVPCELIIAGDFFNLMQVDYRERFPDIITPAIAVEKLNKILDGHRDLFAFLREFLHAPHRDLSFIVGNHDPGLLLEEVQAVVRQAIHEKARFFPRSHAFDGIYIEHGHQFEVINQFDPEYCWVCVDPDKGVTLDLPWGSYFVIDYLNKIKMMRPFADRIKPFKAYLKWALLHDKAFAITAIFKLLGFYLRNRFHADSRRRKKFRLTWRYLRQACFVSCVCDTEAEKFLHNSPYHTMILGHTHKAVEVSIDQGKKYINTGTWTHILEQKGKELVPRFRLTYGRIMYAHGVPQCSLEEWRGAG